MRQGNERIVQDYSFTTQTTSVLMKEFAFQAF